MMRIQTNYDYIPNLNNTHLILVNDRYTLTIPIKDYSVKQIIEAVCQNVKSVDRILYSVNKEELIFYSSVPMSEIEKDVDHFLEEHLWNKRKQYKSEAEKFVGKMEELCESKSNISSQEISLKCFLDMLIEKYQKEMEYIQGLEKKWKYIMIANHILKDEDSTYGCIDRICFDTFQDGILSFDVIAGNTRFYFFIPSDFEKTTVRKINLWTSEKGDEFLEIQEEENALRIVSLLMNDLLTLYKRCEAKSSLYSMMKTHNFPDPISYQNYEIRVTIRDKDLKIQNVSLEVLTKEIELVKIDFSLANKTEPKKNWIAKLLSQKKDSIYDNYTVITSNIRQSNFLRNNLLHVLNKINIARELCDKI